MYFENLHLARAVFPGLAIHSSGNNELKETLNREQPSIIFIDAVSNCNEVVYHDLARVTSWAKTQTERQIAIVIDTTCLPLPLLQSGFLKELPDNVMVAFVESLAKYHQFGMDAVTGGAVLLHAAQEMQDSFRKTRARIGTNIVDTSVGSLPRPSRELFIQRMDRHSRNTKIVCQKLSEASKQSNGIFDSVSWLDEPPANAPWFHASCFTLHLRKEFRSINFYQELEKKVLELCQKYGHPIAFSTSFGFDVSRLYVTAPATRFEEPFLRVSVGTETLSQIHTFVKILEECNKVLAESWKNRFDASPNSRKVELRAIKAVPEQSKFGFKNSVFAGPEGLHNYLCPENYAPSPMVELPSDLNPFAAEGVRLMAKIVPLVPLMNIKSIPAYSMLAEAAARGDLNEVANVIESSSSNTVLSLSVVARLFGIDRTCAIVDHSIAPGLMRMLRLFGIEIFPHPAPGHELFGVLAPRSDRATRCGSQPGWFNPGQYSNKDNPAGFERYLAPEIWNQTEGKISILSCALGTCGTMVGVSRGLRSKNPDIKVVACCPAKGEAVPGPREKSLLHDVTFDWHDVANAKMELGAQDSFKASIKLLRRGLMAGPSSGMNYAGALQYISELKAAGELDSLRNENGEIVCAFLCCDSPLPHVDEYFDALGDEFFPTVHPIPEAD
jgi:cysteine synthase